MALKTGKEITTSLETGKKSVNLRASVADNIGIPKFPDTTISTEILSGAIDVIDTFRKKAEVDDKVDWQYQFNQTSRDHYLNLKDKYKNDPDAMKNAVDNYSKTVLGNTPSAYKSIAENVLAQKNLANMAYATANYNSLKDEAAVNGWLTTKQNTISDTGSTLDTITMSDAPAMNINSFVGNTTFKQLNHNYGSAEEGIVNTGRYKSSILTQDLNSDIIDVESLRVFNLMKKIGKKDGLKYFTNYAAGQDSLPVTPDDTNNPIFQEYSNQIKDPFIRSKIIKKVKDLYDDYNGQSVGALKDSKIKYNLDGEQQYGGILDVDKFKDGTGNANDYVINNMPGVSETDFPKAIEIVDKNIKVQSLVNKAMNNEIISNNFVNDEQKQLFQTAIFRRYGINDNNITDTTNAKFGLAMTLLKNQNLEPTAVIKRLNTTYNVDFNQPGQMDDFKNNLALYNYIKSSDMFPYLSIQNASIYEEANSANIASLSNIAGANKLNIFAKDSAKFTENKTRITKHLSENTSITSNQLENVISDLDINTDTFWMKKFFLSEKNKYAKVLSPDSTTFLPSFASTILTPEVKSEWLNQTITELTYMTGSKEIDINNDEGKQIFYKASVNALNKMNKAGYSATRFTGDGKVKIIKNSFEDKVGFSGQGFDNSIIAQSNYLKATLSKEDQIERFGSKDTSGLFASTKLEPVDISEVIKQEIDNGYENTIIEPTGTLNKFGKPNYHLKINHKGTLISLTTGNNYFDPTGFSSNPLISDKLPASRANLIQSLAQKKYDSFIQTYGHKFDNNSAYHDFAKKVIYGTIKLGIEASDYKFYPDIPGLNDVPAEVKPFAFIFKTLGIDADLEPYYGEAAKLNNEINDILSYDARIVSNTKIQPKDKDLEAIFPPYQTSYTQENIQKNFRQFAYEKYQDKSLPLTLRTNNYMAVMKTDSQWDGEMVDVSTGNQAAIFASPVDSIRAGVRVMINNSTLAPTNTTKNYSDTPTLGEMLKVYAVDSAPYIASLESKTGFTRDTEINFFDSNQMMKIIKFMIEHEMGSDAFNKYYSPNNQLFLDGMIMEGYTKGINSFGGTLGKIR